MAHNADFLDTKQRILNAAEKHDESLDRTRRSAEEAKRQFHRTFDPVFETTRDYIAGWMKVVEMIERSSIA